MDGPRMKLLPREEKFFEYFNEQVKVICRAADLLVEGAATGNAHLANAAHQIRALEEQADAIIHEIYTRLNSTFITPLDPEDIHSLSSHLDDVIDGIEDSVHRMLTYRVDPLPSTVLELCKIVQSCGSSLQKAFDALSKSEPLIEHCIEINRLEEAADQLGRAAVADLFQNERDPIRIMKLKEIYDFLEETTDACEDVADALQNVQVKNS
jgi:predicted phosphate transport protein (TIGR00153 family)